MVIPKKILKNPPRNLLPSAFEVLIAFVNGQDDIKIWSLLQRQKRIVIYYVKKLVRKSQ